MFMDIENMTNRQILIIGDLMVDTYHIGKVKRISPEAPVPVVQVQKTYSVLGGAANVARNIIGLHSCPFVVGTVGNDANGELMQRMFSESHIEYSLLQIDYPTITKTRIIGNNQQIVRADFEDDGISLTPEQIHELKMKIKSFMPVCDSVVISDYGKGLCSEELCRYIITEAHTQNKWVIVDPKGKSWDKYKGASIITPNLKELSDIQGMEIDNEDEMIHICGNTLLKRFQLDNILVTRSEKGMSLLTASQHYDIKTEAKEVFDVSGAGDTVVATLSVALSSSFPLLDSIGLANKAAGVVVGKMGTSPILYEELNSDFQTKISGRKLVMMEDLDNLLQVLHGQGETIVFTNGCFDIIHKGHVFYLQEARKLGTKLIVGLNSDESVRRLKGEPRPINPVDARIAVLEAMSCVDYVIVFEEDTPYDLIKKIQPDVLVKGGDYKGKKVVGCEHAKRVELIEFQDGYSSTKIINAV